MADLMFVQHDGKGSFNEVASVQIGEKLLQNDGSGGLKEVVFAGSYLNMLQHNGNGEFLPKLG